MVRVTDMVLHHRLDEYNAPVAAVVTRVHGDGVVDLTAFPPGAAPVPLLGITRQPDEGGSGWAPIMPTEGAENA